MVYSVCGSLVSHLAPVTQAWVTFHYMYGVFEYNVEIIESESKANLGVVDV